MINWDVLISKPGDPLQNLPHLADFTPYTPVDKPQVWLKEYVKLNLALSGGCLNASLDKGDRSRHSSAMGVQIDQDGHKSIG